MFLLADLDPDLFAGVGGDESELRQLSRVPCVTVPAGAWDPARIAGAAYLGLLVLGGRLSVQIEIGPRSHLEILGPGDVLQPWIAGSEDGAAASMPNWRVLQDLQVAVLDRRFALAMGRHPAVARALMERLVARARRLLFQLAVLAEPRTTQRIELMLWHFADRWGRVTPDGIQLELPIGHEGLAHIVAAQRPSVTTALGRLKADGRVERQGRKIWLLPLEPPESLGRLYEQAGLELSS